MTAGSSVLLVSANRERLPQPVAPIGLLSVAAAIPSRHPTRLVDLCFEDDPHAALRAALRAETPDVVGIGLRNLHTNAYDGTEGLVAEYAALCRVVREEAPSARLVLGGSGFSLRPKTLLSALGADHGVVGEGERAFPFLLDALADRRALPALVDGGMAPQGPVVLGKARELDALPRPRRDLEDPRYRAFDGTVNVQTKRGCAFQCAYCDYPDLEGRKVRLRDPQAVVDEVVALADDPAVTHVFFVDSVFNVPRSHALAICDGLVRARSRLGWVAYVSPVGLDDELVQAMARAGCVGVEIGTDTASDASLKKLKKPFDLSDVRRAREACLRHGVFDCHTFVVGALDETRDEVARSLDFVDGLDPDLAVFIAFMEDREDRRIERARHRDAILDLLRERAPSRPGWVVPELGIRFGKKVLRLVERTGLRGPSWLALARMRRREILARASAE